jgi:SWI/SNF-related matrix-associated actin-dependent regulator 1 of chromatin subfamily A
VSWPIELKKWDLSERVIIHIGHGKGPNVSIAPAVYLVSYDLLSRGGKDAQTLLMMVKDRFFDLLIIDEAQYLKDTASKRTKFVYRNLVPHIPTTWILSGTITPNNNSELFSHLRALFPDLLKGLFPDLGRLPRRQEFEDLFCKIRFTQFGDGRQIVGNRNTSVLREALAPHMLRRKATEVRAEMPPLTIEEREFGADDFAAILSPEQVTALNAAAGVFDKEMKDQEPGNIILTANQASARRALGIAKVPLIAAWAEDLLVNGQDKIILFAHHKDVVAALAAALGEYSPVTITGETSIADRRMNIHRFQTDATVRVMVGNIQAAGTSITLTAANMIGIAEPSWVPGDNTQAIRRSYRIGQTRAVTATYLSVAGSLDARIARVLARKSADIADLLDEDQQPETGGLIHAYSR